MGLFDAIVGTVKKAAENFTVAIQKPVQYVTSTASDLFTGGNKAQTLVNTQLSKPLVSQIGSIVLNTGAAATAVIAGGAALGSTTAKKIITTTAPVVASTAKSLIPATTKGKVIAAVATPIAIGAIASSPKLQTGLITAPSSLVNFGTNVGKIIENPSLATVKETVKENPLISSAVALGGAAAIGGGLGLLANTVATAINTKATNINSAPSDIAVPTSTMVKETFAGQEQTATSVSPTPQTPQTKVISNTTTRNKKRRRKAQKPTIMQQKVNVMVNNSSKNIFQRQNKTYIKREVIALS